MQQPSDRRQFQRSVFQAPVWLSLPQQQGPAQLLDVSLRGALVRLPPAWRLRTGELVQLRLQLAEDAAITMQTRVAHVEPPLLGLHCEHIDLDSLTHLRQLLEHNAADPALLERELAALCAPAGG